MDTSKLKELVDSLQSKKSRKFSLLRDEILRLAEEFRFSLTLPVDIRTSQGKADLLTLAQRLIEDYGLIFDDEEDVILNDDSETLSIYDERIVELESDIDELIREYSITDIQATAKQILELINSNQGSNYKLNTPTHLTKLWKSLRLLATSKYGIRNLYAITCKKAGDELNYKLHLKIAWYEQAEVIDNLLLPPKDKTNAGQYIASAFELFAKRFISPDLKAIRFVVTYPEFCHVCIHNVFSIRCWEEDSNKYILRVNRLDKPDISPKDYEVKNLVSTTLYDTFIKIISDFPYDEF